ncbi:conserved hypothetical protein [Gammaproteobacteria bacterium]
MNINSNFSAIYSNASLGIQRGMQGAARNAAQVAGAEQLSGTADPTQPLLDNKSDSISVRANAKVLKAADDTLGTLLDVMA